MLVFKSLFGRIKLGAFVTPFLLFVILGSVKSVFADSIYTSPWRGASGECYYVEIRTHPYVVLWGDYNDASYDNGLHFSNHSTFSSPRSVNRITYYSFYLSERAGGVAFWAVNSVYARRSVEIGGDAENIVLNEAPNGYIGSRPDPSTACKESPCQFEKKKLTEQCGGLENVDWNNYSEETCLGECIACSVLTNNQETEETAIERCEASNGGYAYYDLNVCRGICKGNNLGQPECD